MSDHPVFPLRLLPMSDDELETEGSPDALAALASRLASETTPETLPELTRVLERLDGLDARDNPLVLMALGEAHCRSDGPRPDRARGLSLLRAAADRGLAEAVSVLCPLLDEGDAVAKAESAERAAAFCRVLFDREAGGDAEAPFYLWFFLDEGRGVGRDPAAALAHLRVAAERGHVGAQAMLGHLLHSGDGGVQDSAEAVAWLRRAADAGHSSAQFWLSLRLARGEGVAKDEAEAARWERRAAERGRAAAQYALAERLRLKEGKPADACVWYGKAAAGGHVNARLMYGRCHEQGWGVPRDTAEAFRHFALAADQGSAIASYNLGILLRNGDGCAADRAAAVARFAAAAERGLVLAQKELADALLGGNGVPADAAGAVRWYTAAAGAGNAAARNMLGRCFQGGLGVPKDPAEAVRHYTLAADAGDMHGAFNLALALEAGEGCAADPAGAVARLRAAAAAGYPTAQRMLADRLLDGDGMPADPAEAVVWFAKAAEGGDTEARATLGLCHLEGWGVPVDQAEAVRHLTPAADAGDPNAAFHLAICLREGLGCAKNRAAAVPRLRAAAKAGDATAQKLLADCLRRGDGAPKDEAEAVLWYGKAADAGNAEARNLLGRCHTEGWGVPKDPAEAVRHYTLAADAGNTSAGYNLALALRKGAGCVKDPALAALRLRVAAEGGNVAAQKLLADCLRKGEGALKDEAEAVLWYGRAADAGNAEARTLLGRCHAEGWGVPKDPAEAVRQYTLAAEGGHAAAQKLLADCLRRGEGAPKDEAEAVFWYGKAADAGNAEARNLLGRCHDEGWGVPKDPAEAVRHYTLAADAGDLSGAYNLALSLRAGHGCAKDRAATAPRLRAAAAAGHVSAQKLLADCLLVGDGVAKDPVEAVVWYRKAADAGDVGACVALADCFARGHGVAASAQEAVRWHRAAAAKGSSDAAHRAATLLHAGGKTKPEDLAAAAALFAQAADAGHAEAANMLGRCHQEGWGVPRDLAAARLRFEAAAEASNHAGMLNYGLSLAYGCGGAADPERAAYWLHRVAESDSPLRKKALETLGVLHRDGAHGFVKSLHEAERLLRLAVAAGQASAAAHLKRTLDLKPAGAAAPAALPDAAARIAYDRRFDRLRAMTGLESVKEAVISLADAADVAIRRRQLGRVATLPTAHLVFTGNPGTGKTTVARIIGEIYRSIGLLRRGHVVEVDRAALVGKWLGETEDKTTEAIQRALDGILFIDEAYALTPEDPGRDFGPQAMEVILKAMEDHRGRLVVIAAGYAKEMQRFLDFNPGLRSRIANIVDFPDYEPQDLHTILHGFAGQEGMQLDELANQKVWRLIGQMHKNRAPGFGNAREMRNLFDTLRKRQASRLRTSAGNLDVIVAADVPDPAPEEVRKDPLRELDALIGLASVKTQVRTWGALVRQEAEMRRIGADQGEPMSNHMAFFGNPGTGKTTVARLIGGILADAGVLRRGHLVECSRADFVGAYQGQTAPKVRKKVEEALDGVLFLDEAYALVKDEQDTYGHEALAELVKCIEDHRDRLVLIVAGYKRETERLFAVNPGLPSRIGTVLTFEDYDASEMLRIFEKLCLDGRYELPLAAREKALAELKAMIDRKDPGFANGRSARNFYQVTIRNLALRRATSRGGPVNRIEAADIPTGMAF